MSQLKMDKVVQALATEGFTQEQTEKVEQAIVASLPAKTYNTAVIYLGIATVALVLGSIALGALDKAVPEALWGALGAGIGGLAGVFVAKQ